jgi:hypothetical protein
MTCYQITEELDGVKISCASTLHVYEEKKNANHVWQFDVSTVSICMNKFPKANLNDMCYQAFVGFCILHWKQLQYCPSSFSGYPKPY